MPEDRRSPPLPLPLTRPPLPLHEELQPLAPLPPCYPRHGASGAPSTRSRVRGVHSAPLISARRLGLSTTASPGAPPRH